MVITVTHHANLAVIMEIIQIPDVDYRVKDIYGHHKNHIDQGTSESS